MLKRIGLASAILTLCAVPAFAQDTCPAPTAPTVADGSTASRDQLLASVKSVKDYIAASDVYQQCVNDYVTAQKAQADKDKKPMDPALVQSEGDKINANQASKQKAGDDINTSIGAYKKAHPT